MRAFRASHRVTCADCGQPIMPGQLATFGDRFYRHADCQQSNAETAHRCALLDQMVDTALEAGLYEATAMSPKGIR